MESTSKPPEQPHPDEPGSGESEKAPADGSEKAPSEESAPGEPATPTETPPPGEVENPAEGGEEAPTS